MASRLPSRCPAAIADDQLVDLVERVGQHLWLVERDPPVDRQLTPSQQATGVSFADHPLVVLIVSETHEVGTEVCGPLQQRARLFGSV